MANDLERRLVAGNVNTPTEVLVQLATDENGNVRRRVAENVNAPTEALAKLATDEDEHVRRAVAGNVNTPTEVLAALAKDKAEYVREGAAENPSMPGNVLEDLAEGKDSGVRLAVAKNPRTLLIAESAATSSATLRSLAKLQKTEIRLAVARHPNTPDETLQILASDKVKKVGDAAAAALGSRGAAAVWTWPRGVKTADDRMKVVANLEDIDALSLLTSDSLVGTRVFAWMRLGELGAKPLPEVHRNLRAQKGSAGSTAAKNRWIEMRIGGLQGAASDALVDAFICADADEYASAEVRAGTPFTEAQLLRMLQGKFKKTAWEVASGLPLTPALLEALSTVASTSEPLYDYSWVPEAGRSGVVLSDGYVSRHPQALVALHPLTPHPIVAKLRKAKSKYVRAYCIYRADTSQAMLIEAAADPEAEIRASAAANPNCPKDIMNLLAADGDAKVRAGAAMNSAAPGELLRALSSDDAASVIVSLAGNPGCPADLLESLERREASDVHQSLAANPGLPVVMLARYIQHHDLNLRVIGLGNPAAPAAALQAASTEPEAAIRRSVAANPNTPPDTLMHLAMDSEQIVRAAVRNNPHASEEIKVLSILGG